MSTGQGRVIGASPWSSLIHLIRPVASLSLLDSAFKCDICLLKQGKSEPESLREENPVLIIGDDGGLQIEALAIQQSSETEFQQIA